MSQSSRPPVAARGEEDFFSRKGHVVNHASERERKKSAVSLLILLPSEVPSFFHGLIIAFKCKHRRYQIKFHIVVYFETQERLWNPRLKKAVSSNLGLVTQNQLRSVLNTEPKSKCECVKFHDPPPQIWAWPGQHSPLPPRYRFHFDRENKRIHVRQAGRRNHPNFLSFPLFHSGQLWNRSGVHEWGWILASMRQKRCS